MARPIRNTPILYGKDAKEFLRRINEPIPEDVKRKTREENEAAVKQFLELVKVGI